MSRPPLVLIHGRQDPERPTWKGTFNFSWLSGLLIPRLDRLPSP